MVFDVTVRHPAYDAFAPAWELMRNAFDGEDDIKKAGQKYLPLKNGLAALMESTSHRALAMAAYEAYKARAEFPDLVALTVRGAVGTILDQAAEIELPAELEPLREKATRDGLTLEALHRRIATELMTAGRYGILPGIDDAGNPYLACYVSEAIINWDVDEHQAADFVVLDETGSVRNRETNQWETVEQYRECYVEGGRYKARVWTKVGETLAPGEETEALDRKRRPLSFLPMVFINTNDLRPDPDDVPLYGLAKLSVRIYQLDADLRQTLHYTSEPTPMVSGYDDPQDAIKNGQVPQGIGGTNIWVLPKDGKGEFLEFTGAGAEAQHKEIETAYDRAVMFGAQMLAEKGGSNESGEAKRVRLDSQHSILKGIAMTSASGLEKALKNVAIWMGANPDQVKVTPNLDFFDHDLDAQTITAIVAAWQSAAISWKTTFDRLKAGGVVPEDRSAEEELALMDEDQFREDEPPDILPNRPEPEPA